MRLLPLSAVCAMLAVPWTVAAAETAGIEPLPSVDARDTAPDTSGWLQQSDMNLTKRADALQQWQGDVSASAGTGSPGSSLTVAPGVTARLGVGYGLTVDVSASGTTLNPNSYRPGVGLKWQFLGGVGHKAQLAVMALYRPEGFNTAEGEVELHLIGGYRTGRAEFAANAVLGGDPDGKDQDIEAKLGAGYRVTSNLLIGGEAQSRAGLGTKVEGWGRQEHVVGPSVQYRAGNFLVGGLVGAGATQFYKDTALEVGGYGVVRLGYHF